MAGIPTEASIIQMVERAMPGRLLNIYAHSCGGGKLTAVMQFKKLGPSDEGRQRRPRWLRFRHSRSSRTSFWWTRTWTPSTPMTCSGP